MSTDAHFATRVGVFALLIGCMCCDQPQAHFSPTIRDSLGVEIVEYPAQACDSTVAWHISGKPILEIGSAEGAEEHQLYDVVGAQVLRGSRLLVALSFSNEVRFFDTAGTFIGSVGKKGGGPGEFETIMGVWRVGADSIGVFDFGNARLTVLTDRGELGRVYRFQQVPGRPLPLPVGPFLDGTFLGRAHMEGTEQDRPEGVHRGIVEFVHWSTTGELLDSPVARPDGERYFGRIGDRPTMASPPYSRQFSVAVAAQHWYYSAMSTYEIEEYSKEGELVRVIRRSGSSRPVSPSMKEAWQREARERWSKMPAPALTWRLALPFPETLPALGDMVVDDLGHLWVAEYALQSESLRWCVYGPSGLLTGQVTTPPDGTVMHAGDDFILGLWRDALGVEQVRMYQLTRAH